MPTMSAFVPVHGGRRTSMKWKIISLVVFLSYYPFLLSVAWAADPYKFMVQGEDMQLLPSMAVGEDPTAFGGYYIYTPVGENTRKPKMEGFIEVDVPLDNTYYVWLRMFGPDPNSDAMLLSFDDQIWKRAANTKSAVWQWLLVGDFVLTKGPHVLKIGHGEINARVDAIFITDDKTVNANVLPNQSDATSMEVGDQLNQVNGTEYEAIMRDYTAGVLSKITIGREFGAGTNPTGNPIGGGEGYDKVVTAGTYLVSTAQELLDALAKAQPGETVYIQPDAQLDLTGKQSIRINRGVTLAGNRGYQGALGPLVFTSQWDAKPLFIVAGPDVRISGIRLRGPDGDTHDDAYSLPNSSGINVAYKNVEIDNCEIFNWSYTGALVGDGGYLHIHHSILHHIQRSGLGYPVAVAGGEALVEANIFNWYRHAIAGSGAAGSGYEARYNILGENSTASVFDMHGGADQLLPTNFDPDAAFTQESFLWGGEYVRIHHNTILNVQHRSIGLRGIARKGVEIHHNWFLNPDPLAAFGQKAFVGNAAVNNNVYGPEQELVPVYMEYTPVIRCCTKQFVKNPYWCDTRQENVRILPVIAVVGAKYGFTNPSAWDTVKGDLPVEVVISIGAELSVQQVTVFLDNTEIYTGKQGPAQGGLVIDTTKLGEGQHQLILAVTESGGSTIKRAVSFHVANN